MFVYRFLLPSLLSLSILWPAIIFADDSFCSQSPRDILASLDGTWTLKQGSGFAVAAGPSGNMAFPIGGMAIPLPPHAPQKVLLRFDASKHFATLSGAEEDMAMIATTEADLSAVSKYLRSEKISKLLDKGSGCNWDSLPMIIGSSDYVLDTGLRIHYMRLNKVPLLSGKVLCLDERGMITGVKDEDRWDIDPCKKIPRVKVKTSEMKMTVILKFQTPNKGSGVLLFEGEQEGYKFSATAPLSMNR